jgi:DNA (cytosine-5)-methyltransferase 1
MAGLTAIDLFAGCGGFCTGMVRAGFNVLASIDIWDKACESLSNNHEHLVLCKDLTKFTPSMLRAEIKTRQVDVIFGGPPCQGFSMAGKRDKNDPRNSLFIEYVKYIEYFKPKMFVMENVPGILSMKNAQGNKVIDIIMECLSNGYNCKYYTVMASHYGVPQKRKRVIFIGIRNDLDISNTPVPTTTEDDQPAVKHVLESKKNVPKNAWLSEKAINGINAKKARMAEKKCGFGAQYLDLNKPCFTIPARYWKDGYDALVKYGETDIRRLTILEIKRIQSFADDYQLAGSKKDQIMQLGNAVPVQLAYQIARHIKKKLTVKN